MRMTVSVNSISLYQDEKGWWVLSELFDGGPPMSFLFWSTAWVCFKWRVEQSLKMLKEIEDVRSAGNSPTVQ